MVETALIFFSYLLGSLPVGVVLARFKGKDPRQEGSGNIGATNVMRTAGKMLGIITLAGDILKGLIPVLVARYLEMDQFVVALVGLVAFLGHLFPIFLRFRGGKGVATALGVFLGISPLAAAISVAVFIIVVVIWRYVSLGSLTGVAVTPVSLFFLRAPLVQIVLCIVMVVLVFVKHGDNIKRLLAGTEHRIGSGKSKEP